MQEYNNSFFSLFIAAILFTLSGCAQYYYQETQLDWSENAISVNVSKTLKALLEDEDTDGDKKITIDDIHIAKTEKGDKRFTVTSSNGELYEVSGTYYLSNLLQELKLADEKGLDTVILNSASIFENPTRRISRMIKEIYWDGLTRRIDDEGLIKIISDDKTNIADGYKYIYVPHNDEYGYKYFSAIAEKHKDQNIRVVYLPQSVSGDYVRKLDGYHGILSLAITSESGKRPKGVPFVVPGGRFNEMYGWDSYFITLGLLKDGRIELAKSMVDNFVYEITYYGKILNANRTYYLTRSQPPFLTSMALAVYGHLPKESTTKEWLKNVIKAAIKEYFEVWMGPERLTEIGLSHYYDSGFGPPPEVEPGHFNALYSRYAKEYKIDTTAFESAYKSGKIKVPKLDEYFVHDRAMRESGHDTSYRLEGRCANLVTVDLNSLLYKIELDIAQTIENEFRGELILDDGSSQLSSEWFKRAQDRKDLINKFLWDGERGMFFDYDFVSKQKTYYISATTLYPLWAGLADKKQADLLVKRALPLLEAAGGIVSSAEESRGQISSEHPLRQWDYPHGWAPHQMLIWMGLEKYGYNDIVQRLVYKWLYTITLNAVNYNGTITEKYDVASRSHNVFAEYGNVGTKFAYITREGFGWTNASYQVGLGLLKQEYQYKLNLLIPPEWIFKQ